MQINNKMWVCFCPLGCLDGIVLELYEFVISYKVKKCIGTVSVRGDKMELPLLLFKNILNIN